MPTSAFPDPTADPERTAEDVKIVPSVIRIDAWRPSTCARVAVSWGENTRIDPDGVKVRALDDATALNGVRGDDDLTSR